LVLFLVGLLIVAIARQHSPRARSDRVYRPRANPWGFPGGVSGPARSADEGMNWIVRRAELDGVRDAYSSAAIDAQAPLWRCGGCQAYYHQGSVAALESQNAGRCALCDSADLRPVRVA
jgi:hypothetical protein